MRLLLLLLLSSPALANIPVQEISEVEKKDNTFEINGQWTLTPDCKIDAQVIHLLFKTSSQRGFLLSLQDREK